MLRIKLEKNNKNVYISQTKKNNEHLMIKQTLKLLKINDSWIVNKKNTK